MISTTNHPRRNMKKSKFIFSSLSKRLAKIRKITQIYPREVNILKISMSDKYMRVSSKIAEQKWRNLTKNEEVALPKIYILSHLTLSCYAIFHINNFNYSKKSRISSYYLPEYARLHFKTKITINCNLLDNLTI